MTVKIFWVFSLIFSFVKTDEICTTPTCFEESARVLSMMDQGSDPCDDFYEFACGKYIKDTVIPDDKRKIGSSDTVVQQLDENLRDLFSEPIKSDEIAPFQDVKKLYQACMNEELVEQRGITPVSDMLNKMGGWPVIIGDDWKEDNWTWQESIFNSGENGFPVNYLIDLKVRSNADDSTENLLMIDKADLRLNRKYLLNQMDEPEVLAYHSYQVDLAVMFGADRSRAEKEMKKVLEFEFELAKISDEDSYLNQVSLYKVQFHYGFIQWTEYLNKFLPENAKLNLFSTVVVGDVNYFAEIGDLLEKTPKRTLANYIKWRQAFLAVRFMPQEFKNRLQVYTEAVTGKTSSDPRWLQCVLTVTRYFPVAVSSLYVRKYFDVEAKRSALEMVSDIKEEFIRILRETDWMDASTRKGAITKAAKMKPKIGFADEYLDDQKIVNFYAQNSANVSEFEYFESVLNLKAAKQNSENRVLGKHANLNHWTKDMSPALVNAGYHPYKNSIEFPAGILQGVFFNADRPKYMNYGGIGFIIGHEITHGFDDDGSHLDGNGDFKNWWAGRTRIAFMQKVNCIRDQYSNYTEPLTNIQLNGEKTQGENIADNGGIKQAYLAYSRWSMNNTEPKLPGLNYTPKQMFWIAASQIWCDVSRKEALKSQILTDSHSASRFRVIGPLSNRNEFAEDFQCKVGTKMNPEKKCQVW